MFGPNCATSGYSTPGPLCSPTRPVRTCTKGVGVEVGSGVSVGVGVSVGTGVSVAVAVGVGVCTVVGVAVEPGGTVAVAVAVSLGIGVAVAVLVGVGGRSVATSIPGCTTMTPGVPPAGGVTTISPCRKSGVGVKVGANIRVGTGVGASRFSKLDAEHPSVTTKKRKIGSNF